MGMQITFMMSPHVASRRGGLLLRTISPANQQQRVLSSGGWVWLVPEGREEQGGRQGGQRPQSWTYLSGDLRSRSDPENEELFGQVLNREA